MKHFPCIQGGEEWNQLRIGLPTASAFSRIITAKKWELAAARTGYALDLVTELALNTPLDQVTTQAMQSGHDWEPKARAAYEMLHGVDVTPCGFCTTDDGRIGASPDGFVEEDGLLEIKAPFRPEHHMAYLLKPDGFKEEYFVQTQGQLYVTGRRWTDLISYFMDLPMVCLRIAPDPKFQEKLDAALKTFLREFADLVELAKARGVKFPEAQQGKPAVANPADWITEDELDQLIALRQGQMTEGMAIVYLDGEERGRFPYGLTQPVLKQMEEWATRGNVRVTTVRDGKAVVAAQSENGSLRWLVLPEKQ